MISTDENPLKMLEDEERFLLARGTLKIDVGALVSHNKSVYRVREVLDFNSVVAVAMETGRSVVLPVQELAPVQTEESSAEKDLEDIADIDWREAERRYEAIRPLVGLAVIGRQKTEERAKEIGVDASTLYRWIKRFKATGSTTSLIPKKRGWREGRTRISASQENVIQEVIQEFYLTPQRPSAQKAVMEVLRRCNERGIESPSPNTIRYRLNAIPRRDRLRGRGRREKAKNRYLPASGSFPGADYPLAVWQIDHTPADIILVDDTYRKPIGRPWITVAVDVYSRMVAGFYLSFESPSETSVAMCVAHAILPKEEWLMMRDLDTKWPVWGVPQKIHVDNGAEFRSNTFQTSCLAYGIHVEYRPVKQPRYGGHVERLIGTLMRESHSLPGTTFSSVKDKEDYDADKHSAMTKSEFETWLTTLICNVYHKRTHSTLGMSPLRKWELGIFGSSETQGTGLPVRPADRLTVLLDFLPVYKRTIQTFGVTIDNLTYYAEALRPWINADDPDSPGMKRKFIFRRDPRDISALWFRDPTLNEYFKIPFANQSMPSMSIWEHRQARELLRKEGTNSVNEAQIMRAVTDLRAQVEESKGKTKKARRQAQRRREHKKAHAPIVPPTARTKQPDSTAGSRRVEAAADLLEEITFEGFGDIA